MTSSTRFIAFTALSLIALTAGTAWSQDDENTITDDQQELFDEFSKKLSNSSLVGRFSIDGREGELKEERYDLGSVTKLSDGDYWLFKARIRYGDYDVAVPLRLKVIWAQSTPVITLDSVRIPGLGTFSARVLFDGDRYSGTWQHDDVGGHLFGRVQSQSDEEQEGEAEESPSESDDAAAASE